MAELEAAAAALAEEGFEIQTRVTEPAGPRSRRGSTACGITVRGADHQGIIHEVARFLRDKGANVENMTTEVVAAPMSGAPLFTMSAVVTLPPTIEVEALRRELARVGERVGVETDILAAPG